MALSPPDPATPSGEAINQLYWFVFAICAVVFVFVEAALVLFIIRFRRRRSTAEEAEGPQIHGNTRLEIIWTVIPAVILVGIAVVVLARSSAVEATSGSRANELVVEVQGHQFYWQYVYPDGEIAIDTARAARRPARAARAGLVRRQPQLVGARADRQARRDSGQDERTPLHCDEGGRLRGTMRGALRRLPHRHADDRRGRLRARVPGPPPAPERSGSSPALPSSRSAARRGTASAPSATGWPERATSGPSSRRTGRWSMRRR